MSRTWDPETRSWSPAPPRHCLSCGVELPRREGKGGPRRYCDAHAPANRAYQERYYAEHRDELRAYQRTRDRSRERIDRVCVTPECNRRFRGFAAQCARCRQWERRHPGQAWRPTWWLR